MDIEKFKVMAGAPGRTKEQLEAMRNNAIKKGEGALARVAEDVLDDRFPLWRGRKPKSGGATPTTAMFRGEERHFLTAKEAYVWLVGHFIRERPDILRGEDWRRSFVAKRNAGSHFARSKSDLFRDSPHLADDPNFYTRLGDGWFANLNLNNSQKTSILHRFAALARFEHGADWKWEIDGTKAHDLTD